jgi:prevent-host-death family protein
MDNLKIVSATEARNNWFEILNWVNTKDEAVTITKNSLPIAKIIGVKTYRLKKTVEIARNLRGFLKDKRVYFPYKDPKVIARERKYLNDVRLWKIK